MIKEYEDPYEQARRHNRNVKIIGGIIAAGLVVFLVAVIYYVSKLS